MKDEENLTPDDKEKRQHRPGIGKSEADSGRDDHGSENFEDKSSEKGRWRQAAEASEPSFVLHPEKGLPDDDEETAKDQKS